MKFNYKRVHIGRRTLKTAVAVIVSLMLVSFYGVTASKMIFAMLGAMNAMEPTFRKSIEACLTQIVGMILGVIAGVLLLNLPVHPLIGIGIGIVFMITLYNVFQIRFSPVLACMMIVTVFTSPELMPFTYAMGRLWDTAIGLGVGMLINVLVLPYDNSIKIRNSIEYLKEEVIVFLEDMFDGDNQYPDTKKLTKTITEMAGQLGILSEQWFPLQRKQNARRLAILQECEGKSRQLLAQMEVLSRMTKLGRLSEENRKRLEACGAKIGDASKVSGAIEESVEADVIINYHVEQILNLRQVLMEELMQFPVKRIITHRMPIYENECKSIYTGQSKEFGPVVMKNDTNIAQLKSEYHMLAKLNGNHSCKVYAFDKDKGQLLEERILPGNKLREEASLEKRLEAFAKVFEAIHISVVEDSAVSTSENKLLRRETETYVDWLNHACEFCKGISRKTESQLGKETGQDIATETFGGGDASDITIWKNRAEEARTIAVELFEKYSERVLLHGDLHHDNLLLRTDGSYVFVDPKGVIGPEIFDLPRFILNELETDYEEEDVKHIEVVIEHLSKRLGYPQEDIRKLFYMETALANIWCIEDGEEVNEEYMKVAEEILSA